MKVLNIVIILLIILLLYKIINVEKYESVKEPFFTLWVSAEKTYEYNTIYVEISDYEKGLIHEIEYKSPELYISNMSKNEYILPVDYSDDFKDYLGKKVAIKFYRNSKNQSDLFHITHTMLPYSKEDESSFDTSKLENDEELIFEEDTYKEEDQVHDCIGEWKAGDTFTEKRLGHEYLKSETNADKWQALLKRPLYNNGALIKAEGMPTLAKGSSEPTTRIQPEYQIGGQEWTYEHIKSAKNGGKECPYQNGKTIKTLYSGSMERNYTDDGRDPLRAPWGMYLAPEAWAPFLNPNINEKIIDDPEYIVTTKSPTYYADINDAEEAKKKLEDYKKTPEYRAEVAAAEAEAEAEAAAAQKIIDDAREAEDARRRAQYFADLEEKAKKKLEEEQKAAAEAAAEAAAAYIEKHRDLTKAGTKETVCESKTREELEKVLEEKSKHYVTYLNREVPYNSHPFGVYMGKVMDSEVGNIEKSCSVASDDDCLTLKNTNYSDPSTEYSRFFGEKMYERRNGGKHDFGVCNLVEYEFGADGERFKV
jgi:hypothetical protein